MSTKNRRYWRISRAGRINGDPSTIENRTSSFASGVGKFQPATVITHRTEQSLEHWLIMNGKDLDSSAIQLAHAVGGKLTPSQTPPELFGATSVATLRARMNDTPTHNTQAGVDLSETAKILADTLGVGEWVSIIARAPILNERDNWFAWLAFRTKTPKPTHHSNKGSALVVTVYAGASSNARAKQLVSAFAASLPGFDMLTRPMIPDRFLAPAVLAFLLAPLTFLVTSLTSGALSLGALLAGKLDALAAAATTLALPLISTIGVLAIALATFMGFIPTMYHRVHRGAMFGNFPSPRFKFWPHKKPKSSSQMDIDGANQTKRSSQGAYPLYPTSFMFGPTLIAAAVAPQGGVLSGTTSISDTSVPAPLTNRVGPLVVTVGGQKAYLSFKDFTRGVCIYGTPGMGKSVLMRSITSTMVLDKWRPSNLPGFTGRKNTIITFASKADDMATSQRWLSNMTDGSPGSSILPIELADPNSYTIDLFAVPGDVEKRAAHFVDAMVYAYGETSIGNASKQQLKAMFAGGLVVTNKMATAVMGVQPGRSPVYYAGILCGQQGDETGKLLAQQIEAQAKIDGAASKQWEETDAMVAWRLLAAELYGPDSTKSNRAKLQLAPKSKIDDLLTMDHYFSAPASRKVRWEQIIKGHRDVIIGTGTSQSGHKLGTGIADHIAAMVMFTLQYNIELHCAGWDEQGRHITIISDELTTLAGVSPTVINWLRKQGRAYGVIPIFATQDPLQLHPSIRSTLNGFSAMIAFKQESVDMADEIARDLSAGTGTYTAETLINLDPYHAYFRVNYHDKRQPVFSGKPMYWDDLPNPYEQFAQDQGYVL